MRFDDSSKIVDFFSNAWKAASDNDIQPDQCQNCFNFSYRLVKTCVVAVCCPKPSEDDPAGLTEPLLTEADQGVVAKQPDRNDMSESDPNSDIYFVGNSEVAECDSVPYESLAGDSPKPEENYESLVDESPKPKVKYESLVGNLSQPEVNVTNEQLGVK
ncbi:hypothetical protein [Endozoicomonas acroporae]|uniref:hypothetical protein n=1 Tax=Endozoicomonas acroporae TaxID=1701104 RepID=UPI0013D10986|nr:hypothetical protein [Endozoicomonas acroporae]